MGLDQNYSASTAEKDYVKNTLETEGVQGLFQKEMQGLQSKIINNFHSANYAKLPSLDTHQVQEVIDNDPDMKARYEAAKTKNKGKGGFSEGILLLQTLAIKCITVLSNNEVVENKLQQRSDLGHKSEAMDGILGPNTFYVLASIAKEKNIPFNGVVDQKLIDTIVDICLEDLMPKPEEDTKQEQIPAEVVEEKKENEEEITIPKEDSKQKTETNNNITIPTSIIAPKEENITVKEITPENTPTTDNKPTEVTEEEKKTEEGKTEEKKEEEKINNIPTEIALLQSIGTIETTDTGYSIDITEPRTYQQFSEISKDNLHVLEEQGYIVSYISEAKNDVISTIEITKKIENIENTKENTKENNEIKIDNYFYPTTDWTEHIAPRIKSENIGNRMTKEQSRNRTDKERNKDSERFIEDRIKEGSIIIDIGSALGNKDPLYAGITVQELYNNKIIAEKTNGSIIATDLDDRGNRETRNKHVKNKKAYDIKVERIDKSLGFMTPVEEIVKKYGTEKSPIIIRSANSIDMLMTEEEALKHFQYIANSLKAYEVTYIFNKYILYKPINSTKFSIIGDINEAGFDHKGSGRKTKENRVPYVLNGKREKINQENAFKAKETESLDEKPLPAEKPKETTEVLDTYPEFKDMEKNLNDIMKTIKKSLGYQYDESNFAKFTFPEEKTPNTISKKIYYNGKPIIELGIGINKNQIKYFSSYEINEEVKTERSEKKPNQNILLGFILQKIEEIEKITAELITKKNQ